MTGKPLRSYADLKTPKKPKGPTERFADLKDDGLRTFVRGLPCLIRNWACSPDVEACHVKSKGAAGGDFDNLVPLCGYHHRQQHRTGIRSFEYRHSIRLKPAARKITASYLKSARSSSPGSPE